ncbi:short-chain dehydrogenase/reductase SDR [Catenulispora acidiphila DSM 44928]|uniref:Short-chain dehydrogenase/reductase SDR n=1 Tax=Catenulispora acidiphila (strain DSM 44928 / JCM 14897 / NBRC 102108 / NRRL B-24433 / ID139908) TaxID=479433 RepID=C7QKE6_CATAD|nr:SDR family NAD(P)-dependent oxidoreductase [Catenulispora acidiphila]ACU75220.1 short-chain dehydrogenase/reductase SDR [Catenulispora acidiphila DSM 44928]
MAISRAVLITGCSSGIGRAAALQLHQAGLPVWATARDTGALAELEARGIRTLQLDVTDEESAAAAVKQVVDAHGAVGTLVNNAGSGIHGAVEDVPLDTVRGSFETNLFGALRLTQLVLPGMRQQGAGRVVNVSSILGRLSPPGGALYQATKYATEAYSDALRLEVAQFGIQVALIEPATVRTRFYETAVMQFAGGSGTPYQPFYDRLAAWAIDIHEGKTRAGKLAVTPEKVAEAIQRAVLARNPKARYPVGPLARAALGMRRMLPDSLFDKFVAREFPAP